MTLAQRIRYLCDGLDKGAHLGARAIWERLTEPKPGYVNVTVEVTQMARDGYLTRRGKRRQYEYRSGRKAMPEPRRPGAPKREGPLRLGFMALARLRDTDPKAYAKVLAAERRRA